MSAVFKGLKNAMGALRKRRSSSTVAAEEALAARRAAASGKSPPADGAAKPESTSDEEPPELPTLANWGSAMSRSAKQEGFEFAERIPEGVVWERYKKIGVLGSGASCTVYSVERAWDKGKFALKELKREKASNAKLFKREVSILEQLRDHPHITKYDCSLVDDSRFFVVYKLCTGGQLFARIKALKKVSEFEAAKTLATILSTVAHMHAFNIAHRDLKLENIVYDEPAPKGKIIIIDFGEAMRVEHDEKVTNLKGTLPYLAPESFRPRQGWEQLKSDVWSIGVIAYLLVAGRYPFWGDTRLATKHSILRDTVRFPSYVQLSDSCKEFIKSLLNHNVGKRPTCEQALDHPWIQKDAKRFQRYLGDAVLQSLTTQVDGCALRKHVVDHRLRHMSEEDMDLLDTAFALIDKDQDGKIDKGDIMEFYRSESVQRSESKLARVAESLLTSLGADPDGSIDPTQFKRAKMAANMQEGSNLVYEFDRMDEDNDGFISLEDLRQVMSVKLSTGAMQQLVDEVDEDGDGVISRAEFMKAINLQSLVPEEK